MYSNFFRILVVIKILLSLFYIFKYYYDREKRREEESASDNRRFILEQSITDLHHEESAQTIECPPPATHITVPPSPTTNQMDHGMIFPGVLHMEPQLNPPPYTAVALPPSYDEAIKQTSVNCNIAIANSSSREANKY